jgi:S1-C subfamily serine protease
MKLVSAPENPPRDQIKLKGQTPFAGATIINISPAVIDEMSVQGATTGVVIAEVEEGSIAQQFNLQRGDIVLAVNEQKIASTRDLEKATLARAYYWKITLVRGGQVFTTVVGG